MQAPPSKRTTAMRLAEGAVYASYLFRVCDRGACLWHAQGSPSGLAAGSCDGSAPAAAAMLLLRASGVAAAQAAFFAAIMLLTGAGMWRWCVRHAACGTLGAPACGAAEGACKHGKQA